MWIPDNKQCLSHCQSECKWCLLLGQIHNSTRQRCSHLIAFYKLPTLLAPITIKQIHVPDAFPKQRWALAKQSVLQWPMHCSSVSSIQALALQRASLMACAFGSPWQSFHCHVLPGARTSGLPFFATVFWRFMTRLCLPGMEKAWFSFPACTSWITCWVGMGSA